MELIVEQVEGNSRRVVAETIRGELHRAKDGTYERQYQLPWARIIFPAGTEIKPGDVVQVSIKAVHNAS